MKNNKQHNSQKPVQTPQLGVFNVIARFFIILFHLMTFTIKSDYEKWFEITSGFLVWLNLFVITYSVLSILNVL